MKTLLPGSIATIGFHCPLWPERSFLLQFFDSVYSGTYPSETAAVDAALGAAGVLKEEEMWAIVVVNKMDTAKGDVDYMIRMNYTTGTGHAL